MFNIGSNEFENVAIPLIFEDRYFQFEEIDGVDYWTVFTFRDGAPIIEILRNNPQQNPITIVETNPTGIITISDPDGDAFLYKIRPGSKNSSIFGRIKGEETEIVITDREIRYGTNVLQNNTIVAPVGIHIHNDGSFEIAAQIPEEIKELITK